MNIDNFRIFNDLVANESFSKAAKLNGITQSAVSQQLRTMEKTFDVLILDRTLKEFRLTQEGKKIHEVAQRVVHQYDALFNELLEMKNEVAGNIRLSTIYSIGLHALPEYISKFMQEFPKVNVRVEYRRANLVYEDVLNNTADIGIVAYPRPDKQLEVIPFLTEELVVAMHPNNPLSQSSVITLAQLKEQKLIGFDPDIPTRQATDEVLNKAEFDIKPVMEFDNIETIKRAVEIEAGVALVPPSTVKQEVNKETLIAIPLESEHKIVRPNGIIHRQKQVLSPALKNFIELLTATA